MNAQFDDLLDQAILGDGPPTAQAPVASRPSAQIGRPPGAIAKISYTHDGMIDLLIAQPAISQGALAAHFGYSQSWVSQVIASDAFQSRLAERKDELVDPTLRATIEEQFKGIVHRSIQILQEKLAQPSAVISDNLALRAMEIASRAAGYGGKPEAPAPAPVQVDVHLNLLANNLTKLLGQKRNAVLTNDLAGEDG